MTQRTFTYTNAQGKHAPARLKHPLCKPRSVKKPTHHP